MTLLHEALDYSSIEERYGIEVLENGALVADRG
ncbi:MAG: hypothetical protein A4E65_00554 [Syntrophorhabdus sp. PtaU1.Bin153]|nr:MAG: hypothetical protein A4E65_00554 [Syntrophorhabdus sp. PtaU1.Bin153]